MKKFILILVLLIFSGCSTSNVEDNTNVQAQEEQEQIEQEAPINLVEENPIEVFEETPVEEDTSLSEYEKYVKVESEMACYLIEEGANQEDPNAIMELMAEYQRIATSYGFTEQRAQEMVEQYQQDDGFRQDVLQEMLTICPGLTQQAIEQNS